MNLTFWKNVINSKDPTSAKRLVTLGAALHFFLTSLLISFFTFYLVIFTPKGSVNKDLLLLLNDVLSNDIIIITGGLAMIGVENVSQMMKDKALARAAANVKVGAPSADTINVDTVNVEQKLKETKE